MEAAGSAKQHESARTGVSMGKDATGRAAMLSWLAVLLATILPSCSAIDYSVPSRNLAFNSGWDAYRNNAILLNIARASHSAPLQFTTISKYTGAGELSAGASSQFVYAAADANPARTFGPLTAGGKTSNSMDVGTLETVEFTQGMLAPVTLADVDGFLRQGLPRELVFHLVLESIRVTRPDRTAFEFRNDPADDRTSLLGPGDASARCQAAVRGTVPFAAEIWLGEYEQDCRYSKFATLLDIGVRNGLRTERILVDNPAHAESKTLPRKLSEYQACYDVALAREFQVDNVVNSSARCGRERLITGSESFRFVAPTARGVVEVGAIVPVLRSPFGVFRYLGSLVATGATERVVLNTPQSRDPRTGDARLLSLNIGPGGCFAEATFLNETYCVPAQGAQNTKAAFSLLATLVALRTRREDLPPSAAIVIRP